jgi:hypothetical protein
LKFLHNPQAMPHFPILISIFSTEHFFTYPF